MRQTSIALCTNRFNYGHRKEIYTSNGGVADSARVWGKRREACARQLIKVELLRKFVKLAKLTSYSCFVFVGGSNAFVHSFFFTAKEKSETNLRIITFFGFYLRGTFF